MNCLYCKLAVTNLKNNRQFYLPYILAGIVSAMMFYIMRAIQGSKAIAAMRGADTVYLILTMGLVIVALCTGIFLFYTNSFVMKRRKKELGVYNILGMEKKHIAKVMAWESVILYVLTVCGGLVLGIVFHKLVAMFLAKLTGMSESIPFYVSGWGCLQTVELFGLVYVLMLLYNFLQVSLANPVALLHGNSVGEREPKVKWISAVAGMGCIVAGYYIAVTVQGILEAVNMFFIAVLLVIAGTYALFLSVSIAFLKILKNNKKYYYQTTHFITVSGMLYRMKRNAVGLANICVLSTMVLVIISTTVCLYAGVEDSLKQNFPKEISATQYFDHVPARADYEKFTGHTYEPIAPGSVMVAASHLFEEDSIEIFGTTYLVADKTMFPDNFPDSELQAVLGNKQLIYIVVEDEQALEPFAAYEVRHHIELDTDGTPEERKAFATAVEEALGACKETTAFTSGMLMSRAHQREEYMALNGGFLFLGLFLGILFLMITVLIIYYKQTSEGYEDRERFAIMTKVGMGRDVVKAAINTQVRTVFFMPIIVAVLHLTMAFPMLKTIMYVFGLMNTELFVGCLVVTSVVFAAIYFIVFRITSHSYYRIVY